MKQQRVALAQLSWFSPSEGGRQQPPAGPVYAATAHFATDPIDRSFSVVLHFSGPEDGKNQQLFEARLNLLAPENLPEFEARLVPGSRLLITEGRRAVAECQIVSVSIGKVEPPFGGQG